MLTRLMRTPRLAAGVLAAAAFVPAACTGDSQDTFEAGVEEAVTDFGLDLSDEQIDCVTSAITEELGGEERLDQLQDDYPDGISEVPDDVRAELDEAGQAAFEACDIDPAAEGG